MSHTNFFSNLLRLSTTVSILIILGCGKNELPTLPTDGDTLDFQSFILEKKNNPHLDEDIVIDIKDDVLCGQLKNCNTESIPTYTTNAQSVELNGVPQISGVSSVDFSKEISYILMSENGASKSYSTNIQCEEKLANQLPHITIVTEGQQAINSKEDYVTTQISIDGKTKFDDLSLSAQIRGRGNSTWTYPKKPFKIKLDDETSILGMAAEKDWILIANYLDNTHLLNAVGFKIGQLLEMSFTNNAVPVELTLNGKFLGTYILTEQIEVKKNRVNVGNDGLLLNLDTNFDEPWQFQSKGLRLPVTIKYPKAMDDQQLMSIKDEFEKLEAMIISSDYPNTPYLDYMDESSIVNYLIVYMLTLNEEINHPKSTYIYKTKTGKYTMGPIWDFDWGFGFEGTFEHLKGSTRPLFWSSAGKGTRFFSRFLEDPAIQTSLKESWANFESNQLSELLDHIDECANRIEGARARDLEVWPQEHENFATEVTNLKSWLRQRAEYMTNFIGNL